MMQYKNEGFIASVESVNENLYTIQPLIIEIDGTNHITLTAIVRDGLIPAVGDLVFVQIMKNNIDLDIINRYFEASETNAIIMAVVRPISSDPAYTLQGNYLFTDNIAIGQDLTVEGDVVVEGNLEITGTLTVGGVEFSGHTHAPGTFANSGGPVTGISGGVI